VLVIGAGFIGRHLIETCTGRGIETTVLTRSPMTQQQRGHLTDAKVVIGDAALRALVDELIAPATHVFYCAGGLMPADSNLDPAADAALTLPPLISVLEALRERPAIGLTFLSSGGTVYGEPATIPVREDHPTEPTTSYGVMKLAAEKYISMYRRLYGVQSRILRCANAYGEHQPAARRQGFIAAALDRMTRGEPIALYGDGQNVRDFVYVHDVVDAMLKTATRPSGPPIVNVGSGEGVTLLGVLDVIREVTGTEPALDLLPDRGFDVRRIVLDISLLHEEIDFSATPLRTGIAAAWSAVTESGG
jgi:UDP-glucose 4-epimerase